ncbi:hypothetical protein C0993_001272 [Termitomyces sp. T159_Od127]|nr:hypothetical protein C0993_001272 [Termitomyces sp. T159_Od127]
MGKCKEAVIVLLVEEDLWFQDKFWQEAIKESEVDAQQRIARNLEALVQEGLGLGETTSAGKGSQQGQEEEQGAKERMPESMAGDAPGAPVPATPRASAEGIKRPALPVKKSSPTKPASKHRGCKARYERPTQSEFTDKELARLLIPRQVEAVVDMEVEARIVLKETKGKATVDLVTHQALKAFFLLS